MSAQIGLDQEVSSVWATVSILLDPSDVLVLLATKFKLMESPARTLMSVLKAFVLVVPVISV